MDEQQIKKEAPSVVKTRRLLNRWSVLALLAVSAFAIVLFISNALAIGKLAEELESLNKEREKLHQQNESLKADIIRLESADNISMQAKSQLGMMQAPIAPKKLP